ncbi:MAG TPA: pilus assembly protein TadG-related protein, partial [Tepidisphaeraceae bacterium]|nr:pilus assembly protein TadG-related protein [Tepidisphaeraceae bacterium]
MFGRARLRVGAVLLWMTFTLPLLLMFVSLAVDLGVIQVAKTQLQTAVDSAARHAARGALDGTAITRAISAAAQNSVNGAPLALLSSDVELGRWNVNTRAFAPAVLSGGTWTMADGTKINAVRISGRLHSSRNTGIKTLFANVLSPNSTNILSTVIATGGPTGMPPSALHRFNESSGSTCADDAPNPAVQSAFVADSSKTSWTGGGLRFNSATKAVTSSGATNVTDNLASTNNFTVFGRIRPTNFTQTNASIVSIAANASTRNFTVRQQAGKLEFLMTTSTGSTSLQSATFMTGGTSVHYDFCATFDGSTLKLYTRLNSTGVSGVGTMVSTGVTGNIAGWNR